MTKLQKQVKQFHETFGLAIADKPTVADFKTRRLRYNLIFEELHEFADACGLGSGPSYAPPKSSLIEIADALGDLLYVVYGAAVSFGIDLEPVTDEIHESNMRKVGGHRNEAGKWIKPENWVGPDLGPILEEQGK